MWRKFNVENKGLGTLVFKGFVADDAKANWNVVCIFYGIGDLPIKMVDKKCTCFFHWTSFPTNILSN
jgi:hypothetical protein